MPPPLDYQGYLAKNHSNVFHKIVCFEVNKNISFDPLQVMTCFYNNQYPESVRYFYLIALRSSPHAHCPKMDNSCLCFCLN